MTAAYRQGFLAKLAEGSKTDEAYSDEKLMSWMKEKGMVPAKSTVKKNPGVKKPGTYTEEEKKEAFARGFAQKCAEMGVDPNELLKVAVMPMLGVQQHMPVSKPRKFTKDEESQIAEGQSQWLPQIFQSYKTPVPKMMASPAKTALILGLLGAGVGGGLGAAVGSDGGYDAMGGIGGGVLGAGIGGLGGGLLGYFGRRAGNETLEDLMSRYPVGATKRDIMSDPVYQADLNRQALMAAGAAAGGGRY